MLRYPKILISNSRGRPYNFLFRKLCFSLKFHLFQKGSVHRYFSSLKTFEEFNNSLSPALRIKNPHEISIYDQYLFLERLIKSVHKDQNLKSQSFLLKDNILKTILKSQEAMSLTDHFIEFLFVASDNLKRKAKEDESFSKFLKDLYPKKLIINMDFPKGSLTNLIKLLQVFSKNEIKNEDLMLKILDLFEQLQKKIYVDRVFNKQIAHLNMIFFKNDYLNENTEKYVKFLINFSDSHLSDFDGESLSLLLYAISLGKIDKSLMKNDFCGEIMKNLLQRDFKAMRIGNLIRTLYNVFSIEIKKDDQNLINLVKKITFFLNQNFKLISSYLDLAFIGCVLNKLDTFPDKKAFNEEIPLLATNFCDKLFNKITEPDQNKNKTQNYKLLFKKDPIPEKISNQSCTHLLLGLYTSSVNLSNENNVQKIERNFKFIEEIFLKKSLSAESDMKFFKHMIFYFAKSNQGSEKFWLKIEKEFEKFAYSMNLEDISYLTSSFKTNLPFGFLFWKTFERRVLEILEQAKKSDYFIQEQDFKNVIYMMTYHQKGSSKFWKYIQNILQKREIHLKPETLLKIVNYMKNIQFVEEDFLMSFLQDSEIQVYNEIIPYAMNLVSLMDFGKFGTREKEAELSKFKKIIRTRLQEKYFKEQELKASDVKTFTELCWIINKLRISELYVINEKIVVFFLENVESFKKELSNDNLMKFTWVIFALKIQENTIFIDKLQFLILDRLPSFNASMVSLSSLLFGSNQCANAKFWKSLLDQIKAKFPQLTTQQIIHCFCGIAEIQQHLEGFKDQIYEMFANFFLEQKRDLTKKQCKELMNGLNKIMKQEDMYLLIYRNLEEIYKQLSE